MDGADASWQELFERAADFEVSTADVVAELRERRDD